MDFLSEKVAYLLDELMRWSPRLIGAVVVLLIGLWIINQIGRVTGKAMARAGLDKDVVPFLNSILNVLLKVLLIFSVAGMVGIETTSFIALIGMAGLAIGMALQGTLSHFASGVMVMIFKPYRVGDLVVLDGKTGHVEEIQIFNTVIRSPDNKRVIIPNGIATGGIMENLSANEYLRVDLSVGITYEDDFEKARGVIWEALMQTPHVRKDPTPVVEIEALEDNGVKLAVRPYADTGHYWDVYFGAYKQIHSALAKAGIAVPYPREIGQTGPLSRVG